MCIRSFTNRSERAAYPFAEPLTQRGGCIVRPSEPLAGAIPVLQGDNERLHSFAVDTKREGWPGCSVVWRVGLCLPATQGSPPTASVLPECLQCDTAPVALLLVEGEPAAVLSCLVRREFCDRSMTVVELNLECFTTLATGTRTEIVES